MQRKTARRRSLFRCEKFSFFHVSTHSPPKVAAPCPLRLCIALAFQHTATRRWLRSYLWLLRGREMCFNTQPPEGGCLHFTPQPVGKLSFNTQPPEGGCVIFCVWVSNTKCFNTQPPEGGCLFSACWRFQHHPVSTHSHPKVAAKDWRTYGRKS